MSRQKEKGLIENTFDTITNASNPKVKKLVEWASKMIPLSESEGIKEIEVFRGQIWDVDFGENIGSETNKIRPALVVQNNRGNKHGVVTIVIPISKRYAKLPTHLKIRDEYLKETDYKTPHEVYGTLLAEQVRAVSKARLIKPVAQFNQLGMKKVSEITMISLGLHKPSLRSQVSH